MKPPKKIKRLTESTISQIAAGEVIENPASIIKELVENSIDAGAGHIQVNVQSDGFESIQVIDDGHGIPKEGLSLAVQSFTTSKLNRIHDLYDIQSYGFRGEALGAISSIANMMLESKAANSDLAYKLTQKVNGEPNISVASLPKGTRIIVSDLFHKIPVRKEFNRNLSKIKKMVIDTISNFALCYPSISYQLKYNDKPIFDLPGVKNLSERIEQLFSTDFLNSLIPIYHQTQETTLEGYISGFQFYKNRSEYIRFFINQRNVIYTNLIPLLKKVYGELMPPGRFPIAFLFLHIPSQQVDVNVHPQKMEVRFIEKSFVDRFLYQGIQTGIESHHSLSMKHLEKKRKQPSDRTPREYIKPSFSPPLQISEKSEDHTPYTIEPQKIQENETIQDSVQNIQSKENQTSTVMISPNEYKSNPFLFSELKLHEKLYETFVIATSKEGIYLFDQHTVHERINYEKFLKQLSQKQGVRQELLVPIPLHLSPSEKELIQQDKKRFNEIGFEIEEIGPSEYGIRSIPFYVNYSQGQEAFQICLEQISHSQDHTVKEDFQPQEIFDKLAASLACRGAVKKGDSEPLSRIKELINELKKCENPMRCPHGRPTVVFLGKDDISVLFKRKSQIF